MTVKFMKWYNAAKWHLNDQKKYRSKFSNFLNDRIILTEVKIK